MSQDQSAPPANPAAPDPTVDGLTLLAKDLGSKPALIDDRPDGTVNQWSFTDLEANANRLAHVLRGHGVGPGTKIMVCGQNSCWVVAFGHASRKIGAVAVPLNYRLTPEEATYVVDNSDTEVVFCDAEFASLFATIRPQTPKVRAILVFDGEPGPDMINATEALAAAPTTPPGPKPAEVGQSMIYTSGTTGKPKGAVRPSVGNPELMLKLVMEIGFRNDDIYLTTGPLYHSGPSGIMNIAQTLGNTVVLQRKFDVEDWLRLVDKYKVTSTFSAPTPIRWVSQLPEETFQKYDVSSMRIMLANAAPWSFALKKLYLSRFPAHSLFEIYGSTELGINTLLRPEYQLTKPGSCGKPAPGVEIVLFDENGNRITTPHTQGELYVRSASAFSTYYKAHDKYLEDQRGQYQTVGDIAYFDEEGFFFICDRKKDMIISGGVNIYPAEIEDTLEHHPQIDDVAVFGIPDEEWGEAVHAVVVLSAGADLSAEDIQAYARQHLTGYKVPRSISFMEEIPRTGSGKILKRDLRAPFWKNRDGTV